MKRHIELYGVKKINFFIPILSFKTMDNFDPLDYLKRAKIIYIHGECVCVNGYFIVFTELENFIRNNDKFEFTIPIVKLVIKSDVKFKSIMWFLKHFKIREMHITMPETHNSFYNWRIFELCVSNCPVTQVIFSFTKWYKSINDNHKITNAILELVDFNANRQGILCQIYTTFRMKFVSSKLKDLFGLYQNTCIYPTKSTVRDLSTRKWVNNSNMNKMKRAFSRKYVGSRSDVYDCFGLVDPRNSRRGHLSLKIINSTMGRIKFEGYSRNEKEIASILRTLDN